ncbi:MAG TPA: hypothetical protein DHN29_20845 [Cytophagales bacterium]|jgi:glycosyltransferase involved in cell wall biosynthesis|nr:hypothetical protein [Cytophagales bacterium]|tara:strand:+ start:5728 stop:7314 length:1587 start_codon:yes stop_codon:yes gene_type:complete
MKILAITDGGNWCLDKLTKVVVDGNPQHSWKVMTVHPKKVVHQLDEVEKAMDEADLVWHQYFRTATQLYDLIPDSFRKSPQVLTHHNQSDKVLREDFRWADYMVCHTQKMREKLIEKGYDKVCVIPHGIDLDFFDYDSNPYEHDVFTVGYVGRTKPWKRLAKVAEICNELSIPMVGMGRRDDGYANEVNWENIDWHEGVEDDERFEIYKKMSCFVQFSYDCSKHEEAGPMPLHEAMASGIPVITTNVGFARDWIQDGKNGLVVDNEQDLKYQLIRLKEDPKLCKLLREKAWDTVKQFSEPKMAIQYERLFNQIKWSEEDTVSVVIPTYQRPEQLEEIIDSIEEQEIKSIEVVVADDDPVGSAFVVVKKMREKYKHLAIKYVRTGYSGYGLARARNLGAIEAQGHYLVFLDDRYCPEKDALTKLVMGLKVRKKKAWVFGDKGAGKKTFIENFSAIRRKDFIDMGMFCERITAYGGMSQECRTRALHQGFDLGYVPEAKAKTIINTRRMRGRRKDIWRMKQLLHRMGLSR